jgi:hypothetical protein
MSQGEIERVVSTTISHHKNMNSSWQHKQEKEQFTVVGELGTRLIYFDELERPSPFQKIPTNIINANYYLILVHTETRQIQVLFFWF